MWLRTCDWSNWNLLPRILQSAWSDDLFLRFPSPVRVNFETSCHSSFQDHWVGCGVQLYKYFISSFSGLLQQVFLRSYMTVNFQKFKLYHILAWNLLILFLPSLYDCFLELLNCLTYLWKEEHTSPGEGSLTVSSKLVMSKSQVKTILRSTSNGLSSFDLMVSGSWGSCPCSLIKLIMPNKSMRTTSSDWVSRSLQVLAYFLKSDIPKPFYDFC